MPIQTKHIPTEFVLEAIYNLLHIPALYASRDRYTMHEEPLRVMDRGIVGISDLVALWPDIPEKVLRSKLDKMEQQNLVFESFGRYSILQKGLSVLGVYQQEKLLSLLNPNDFLVSKLVGHIVVPKD